MSHSSSGPNHRSTTSTWSMVETTGNRQNGKLAIILPIFAILLFSGITLTMLSAAFDREIYDQKSALTEPFNPLPQPTLTISGAEKIASRPSQPTPATDIENLAIPAAVAGTPPAKSSANPFDLTHLPQPSPAYSREQREPEVLAGNSRPEPAEGNASKTNDLFAITQANATEEPAEETEEADELTPDKTEDLPTGSLSIIGRVLNQRGKPLAETEVTAVLQTLFSEAEQADLKDTTRKTRPAVSDHSGTYRFDALANGAYQLHTKQTEKYAATTALVRAGVKGADLIIKDLESTVQIYGMVLSTDYEPLENVQITLLGRSTHTAKSDETGTYQLKIPVITQASEYVMLFTLNGYKEKRISLDQDKVREGIEIQLDAQLEASKAVTRVTGVVVAGDTHEPIKEQAVHLYSQKLARRYYHLTDTEGTFSFPEVEAATDYQLSIRPDELYTDYIKNNIDVNTDELNLDITMEPMKVGAASGQMIDINGAPVPEFSLWLKNQTALNWKAIQVTGDMAGYFHVDGVPTGKLEFESKSSPKFKITNIDLSAAQETAILLTLDWGTYQLRGQITDSEARPIAGANTVLTWFHRKRGNKAGITSHSRRETISDAQGSFSFSELGPGIHTITVETPGFNKSTLRHTLGSNDNKLAEIKMTRSTD